MIQIIPNWHPIFVHFTIALLITASILQVAVLLLGERSLAKQWQAVVKWNLWLGAGFAVVTVISGIIAFNSVDHDTPSHLAMLEHRSWALVTAPVFIIIAIWAWLRHYQNKPLNTSITGAIVVAAVLLLSTAWHGSELVYRHGLGVMSLPDQSNHDHDQSSASHEESMNDHSHEDVHTHDASITESASMMESANEDNHAKDASDADSETAAEPEAGAASKPVHIHADGTAHEH